MATPSWATRAGFRSRQHSTDGRQASGAKVHAQHIGHPGEEHDALDLACPGFINRVVLYELKWVLKNETALCSANDNHFNGFV